MALIFENIGSKYKGGDLVRRIHSPHSGLLDLILLVSIVFVVLVIGLSRVSYADDLKNSELTSSISNLKLEILTSNTDQRVTESKNLF